MMEQNLIKQSGEDGVESPLVKRVICGGAAESLLPYMEDEYDLQQNLLMLGLKVIKEDALHNA